jgi:hypothetical protein
MFDRFMYKILGSIDFFLMLLYLVYMRDSKKLESFLQEKEKQSKTTKSYLKILKIFEKK